MIRGEPVKVRGRQRPIELLFNLEHPDQLSVITEVDDNSTDAASMTSSTPMTRGKIPRTMKPMPQKTNSKSASTT